MWFAFEVHPRVPSWVSWLANEWCQDSAEDNERRYYSMKYGTFEVYRSLEASLHQHSASPRH